MIRDDNDDSRFVFFGAALAIGGTIHGPVRDSMPDQVAVVLPPFGGHAHQARHSTVFRDIVSTGKVCVTVVGEEHKTYYSTLSTTTIENLNIMGVVKADAIVSRVAARYPKNQPPDRDLHDSQFYGLGSALYGLKINGEAMDLRIHDPFADGPTEAFRMADDKQTFDVLDDEGNRLCRVDKDQGYRLYKGAIGSKQVYCGSRNGVNQRKFAKPRLPLARVPEFGRVFGVEHEIYMGRATLNMLRVELGCAVSGNVVCASSTSNGHPVPVRGNPGG